MAPSPKIFGDPYDFGHYFNKKHLPPWNHRKENQKKKQRNKQKTNFIIAAHDCRIFLSKCYKEIWKKKE